MSARDELIKHTASCFTEFGRRVIAGHLDAFAAEVRVSRIVIEFYTDSERQHNDMTERIAEYAEDVMCGPMCTMTNCRLVGSTTHRLTLEQFDKELED